MESGKRPPWQHRAIASVLPGRLETADQGRHPRLSRQAVSFSLDALRPLFCTGSPRIPIGLGAFQSTENPDNDLTQKAVPLFVAVGAVLGTWLMDSPFTFRPLGSGSFWVPQGTEAAVAAILLTMGIGLCVFSCMHQKKQLL